MLAELGLGDLAPMPSSALAVVTDRGDGGGQCQHRRPEITDILGKRIAVPSGFSYRSSSEADLSDLNTFSADISSISDTVDLSNELRLAAERCQQLAEKMKKKKDKPALEEPNKDRSCCQEAQAKLRTTMLENIKYRQVVKDVSEINKRWQKYNRQQQEYIQRLLANTRTLQQEKADAEMAAILKRPEAPEYKRMPLSIRHSDSSILNQSATMCQLRQSYENAVKDSCRLEKELEEVTKKEQDLREQVAMMKEIHQEEKELLAMQIKVHKEDWEAEKAEKESEKNNANRLKEQIVEFTRKLRNSSDRLSSLERFCRCGAVDELEGLRLLRRHRSASPSAPAPYFLGNGIMVDGAQSHSQPELLERGASNQTVNGSFELVNGDKDTVICPGCQRNFSSEEHINFLDHFESCQNK